MMAVKIKQHRLVCILILNKGLNIVYCSEDIDALLVTNCKGNVNILVKIWDIVPYRQLNSSWVSYFVVQLLRLSISYLI